MSILPPNEVGDVSLELERIRRSVDVGFTDIGGRLNLLLQRADQTDTKLNQQVIDSDGLEKRVSALEQKVWMASGAATILGAAVGILVPGLLK